MVKRANPFDGLLGVTPKRLPKSRSQTVVVAGQPVTDVRQIDRLVDEPEYAAQLREAVKVSRNQANYQRERDDAQSMAKRRASQATPERREYMRQYREANRERLRENNREWHRAKYQADPEAGRAKRQAEYWANVEHERELARARYQRKKAARAANQSGGSNDQGGATA